MPPVVHDITFRLDGFGTNSSGIELTNVELGIVEVSSSENAAGDSDNDGIPDDWEIANFGDLVTVDGTTDTDSDCLLDANENEV